MNHAKQVATPTKDTRTYAIFAVGLSTGVELVESGYHQTLVADDTGANYHAQRHLNKRFAEYKDRALRHALEREKGAWIVSSKISNHFGHDVYSFVYAANHRLVALLPMQDAGKVKQLLKVLPATDAEIESAKAVFRESKFDMYTNFAHFVVAIATGTNNTTHLERAIKAQVPFFGKCEIPLVPGAPPQGTTVDYDEFMYTSNYINPDQDEKYMATTFACIAESHPEGSEIRRLLRLYFETCIANGIDTSERAYRHVITDMIEEFMDTIENPLWYIERTLYNKGINSRLTAYSDGVATSVCTAIDDCGPKHPLEIIDLLVKAVGPNAQCVAYLSSVEGLSDAAVWYLQAVIKHATSVSHQAGRAISDYIANSLFGGIGNLEGRNAEREWPTVAGIFYAGLDGLINDLHPASISSALISTAACITDLINMHLADFSYGQTDWEALSIANAIIRKAPHHMYPKLRQYDAYTTTRKMPKMHTRNAGAHPQAFEAIKCFVHCAQRTTPQRCSLSNDAANYIARIAWDNAYTLY